MDGFNFLYDTDDIEQVFGDKFCGPKRFEHGEETLVAKFENDPESDGYEVEVYCCSMPADFFKIVAKPSVNSIGKLGPGFEVTFGSGCCQEAHMIAGLINDGMLGVKEYNAPQNKKEAEEQQATAKCQN